MGERKGHFMFLSKKQSNELGLGKPSEVCIKIPEGQVIWGDSGPWAFHTVWTVDEIMPIVKRLGLDGLPSTFETRFSGEKVFIKGQIEPLIVGAISGDRR